MPLILSFKIRSGEEVVAEVESTVTKAAGEDGLFVEMPVRWVLKRPHVLRVQQVQGGQLGLSFVPWCLSNPDIRAVTLEATSVLATFAPSAMVERQYIEQTSGISLATS